MKFDINDVVVYHPFKTDSFYDAQVIEIREGADKPYLLKLKGAENIWAYPVEVQSIAETYPYKPKYKEGDKVFQKKSPHIWRTITKVMDDGTYVLDSEIYDVTDDDIEPYVQVYKEDEYDNITLKVGDEVIANIGRPVPAKILKILDNGFVIVSYQDITKKVSLNNISRYEDLCGDEFSNDVENEKESLNLIEFLQGHEGESFYCLLNNKDVRLNSVKHDVIYLQIDDDHIVNLRPEGTAFKGGLVLLYPSYALYEKYPMVADAAWNEWKEKQTPKRWRARYGERYWYVKDNFEVAYAIDRYGDASYCGGDDERYALGNYFQTDKEAQYAADALIRCLDKVHEELLMMRNDYNTK